MQPRQLSLPKVPQDLVITDETTLIPRLPQISFSVSYNSEESEKSMDTFIPPTGYKSCKVLGTSRLTGLDAPKQTYSFKMEYVDHSFQPGHSFDLICQNSDKSTNVLLDKLSFDPKCVVNISGDFPFSNVPISIHTIFKQFIDINFFPKKAMLRHLSEFCSSSEEAKTLLFLSSKLGSSEYLSLATQFVNITDFLHTLPSCKPSLECLLHHLPLLYPRAYSVCSNDEHEIEFICTINSYSVPPPDSKLRIGVCSQYFLDSVINNPDVSLYIKPRPLTSFQFIPLVPNVPIIMICAGAGVSPFVGFLRYLDSKDFRITDSWLFYGFRSTQYDFLFKDELETFTAKGILANLRIATSREEGKPKYVQDALLSEIENIFPLLESKNGLLYLCGDELTMIKAVNEALLNVCTLKRGSPAQGKELLEQWTKQKRILRDIWI
jgi:methionine synthase reductase